MHRLASLRTFLIALGLAVLVGACGVEPTLNPETLPQGIAPNSGCEIGGCSGQLCGDNGESLGSNCEWIEAYGCYAREGVCGRDANGECTWLPTPELQSCLEDAS